MNKTLILASTSPFRQQLLHKIALPFECISPNVDETPHNEESPQALVQRLAIAKAQAVAANHANSLIIGGDQVAVINGQIVGKPHHFDAAFKQLKAASNQVITFYTGLCLYNSDEETYQVIVEPFNVHFRQLSDAMITGYLNAEQPYNCAGSFKSEGLGIALFSKLDGKDPNTLVGLPLISLIEMLNNQGIEVLEHCQVQ
ncbi:nucleoside triphosphate pyrophosphatase [Psychrobium sp. 1_MG-2023]|uniref:Maf family protein n=1 Tax=Psychrobium sp. 1_MG-2023 TaxID=3062624 RepID=UPI000C32DB67|nr:nucleoside triphosphate pyrophosphatase [Psychrobium sp. 1_MG-2023]MDP2562313.1 nucleoside triphosphate pyrophosphatase [Psychrobium sp. 1_MG-2023]PKF58077.1 septum formation inhibitor Maf [Alteromonadales bacterium alter-6D02]